MSLTLEGRGPASPRISVEDIGAAVSPDTEISDPSFFESYTDCDMGMTALEASWIARVVSIALPSFQNK
eukprot:CAMPEP_0194291014 /NCGR_PEP_ID=MMETSP0169-20130528/42569_1 /TAXON_ID=218684 /ORGANISM="Corethron pennatum, Strain L29A3" /LENGTH=68 /DNA_ID=CAMNT_0039038775 /DNA_START=358 /DNA_END=561 /DNA_ORIENTATION=+